MAASNLWRKLGTALSRRELFRNGGLLASIGALGAGSGRLGAAAAAQSASDPYRAIGVKPVINARGTFTIISGSQSLPEVKRAMEAASRNYVHLDELMEGAGRRLAELTKAEWGMITAGCAAAMTHCTAACIAGMNPERMQKLPDLTGLKNEVIIPAYSRNVYDHAIRMLGVKIVEPKDMKELEAAFNERTAMVYILAGPGDEGPLGTAAVSAVAKRHNVPLLVDAAAEGLSIPNIHLQRGATVVAYSGGKALRGPQAAGLLLGEKSLIQAAWLNSAPHHAFGRSLKVGKEEIMGMLAAVEAWTKRDHEAEYKNWESWLDNISKRVKSIDGVTTNIRQPQGLSNKTPTLVVQWDAAKLGITGQEASKALLDSEPRIVLGGASGNRPGNMASSLSITPWMMMPGDDKIVADRLVAVLTKPPKMDPPPQPSGDTASVGGQWDLHITFGRGMADHSLVLEQQGSNLMGTHRGEFLTGDLRGAVAGNEVRFRSSHKIEGTRLSYEFTGKAAGDAIEGTVQMGEYGEARWTARRHQYGTPGGVVRPVKNV